MCHACEESGRICNIGQPCALCLNSSKLCHYNDPDKLRLVWRQSVERYGREQALERLANMVREEGSQNSSQDANQIPMPLQIHAGILKSHHIDALGHFNGETSGLMGSTRSNVNCNELTLPQVTISPPPVSAYNQTHLLDSYFTQVHPRYPFIAEKELNARLETQTNGQPSSFSTLFLYAIFAAGAKMMPTSVDFSTKMFFDYCMQIKHLFMDRPRTSTICALALLSACCPETTTNGQSSKMLSAMLASEANTMARIMGLHRNLSEIDKPVALRDRCRIFWILFVTDRLYSMTNGYPVTWDEKQINVSPPVVEDYADEPEMITIMQDFHYYIKLCKIVGRICNHGYAPKSEEMRTSCSLMIRHFSLYKPLRKQDTMLSTLDSWITSYILELPQHLRYDPSTIVATPRMQLNATLTLQHPPKSLFARLIHLIIHTCLILLHSPYISDSDMAVEAPKQPVASQPSLDLCVYAATLITHITSVMIQEYPIMTSQCPYTTHSLMIAIRIHLMCAICKDSKLATSGRNNFFQSANTLHRIADAAGKMWIIETLHALHYIFTTQQQDQEKMKMQSIDSKRKVKAEQQRLRRKKSFKRGYASGANELAASKVASPINQQRDSPISSSVIANMQVAAVVRSPSSASSTSSSPSNPAGTRDNFQCMTPASDIKITTPGSGEEMYATPFAFPVAAVEHGQAVGDLMNLNNLESFAPFGSDLTALYGNPMFPYPTSNNTAFMNSGWQPPNPTFDPNYGF